MLVATIVFECDECAAYMSVSVRMRQLEEWDHRTGVITTAKETTAAIQQRVIGAMSKAAENERVQSVVAGVSTGVSSGW